MTVMEYINWDDPFMRLKTGTWGPTWDLAVERQAMVSTWASGCSLFKAGSSKTA